MTFRRNKARTKIASVLAVLGAALLVTACGSSSSSSSSAPTASSTPASSRSTGSATAISITTAKGTDGTYLVGPSGRPIYLWVADSGGKSACAGTCAKVWPPVIAGTKPTVSGGVNAADLEHDHPLGRGQASDLYGPPALLLHRGQGRQHQGPGERLVRRQVVAGGSVRLGDHRQGIGGRGLLERLVVEQRLVVQRFLQWRRLGLILSGAS